MKPSLELIKFNDGGGYVKTSLIDFLDSVNHEIDVAEKANLESVDRKSYRAIELGGLLYIAPGGLSDAKGKYD